MTSLSIIDYLESQPLSTNIVMLAYRTGWFPMGDSESEDIYWHCPNRRAIFPLDNDYIPKSLKQFLSKNIFNHTINNAFEQVIQHCANRPESWITEEIIDIYTALHIAGHAHSIETWLDGKLVGGLYGVSVGSAFFGESMFSLQSNASKSAFIFLKKHLISQGFTLLDSQYINDFTQSLGAIEISRVQYLEQLSKAVVRDTSFVPKQ